MCTAIAWKAKYHYFGRNLDLEYSYNETVTITPRNYRFDFIKAGEIKEHYAIIGMAYVVNDYPLYYDATNEKGLSMAGLSFYGNACYRDENDGKDNISPYEFIPWILCQCANINDAMKLLKKINLINIPFSEELLLTDLHWIIADKDKSIVVEPLESGLKLYENPVGVLTNNPPFEYHLQNLNNYAGVSNEYQGNNFLPKVELNEYSRGMGGFGIPGDLSSMSRFVKACFTLNNSHSENDEADNVGQFFHILGSVEQQKGCTKVKDKYEITIYSSCCNCDLGIYYYRTYNNSRISSVKLFNENLDTDRLINFKLNNKQDIFAQNPSENVVIID